MGNSDHCDGWDREKVLTQREKVSCNSDSGDSPLVGIIRDARTCAWIRVATALDPMVVRVNARRSHYGS